MSQGTKMIVVLTVITMVSGGLLSTWHGYTAPKIEYHRMQALKAAIADVLPEHTGYDEIQTEIGPVYKGWIDQTTVVGYAFRVKGNGFQGNISIMVGVTPDFSTITGIKVLEQLETPGLGTKIVEDPTNKANPTWFPDQFTNLDLSSPITVVKNRKPSTNHEVQAITGATISSKAVAGILNKTIADVHAALLKVN